jgi:imidazolonepropionase-like amidohydrolase
MRQISAASYTGYLERTTRTLIAAAFSIERMNRSQAKVWCLFAMLALLLVADGRSQTRQSEFVAVANVTVIDGTSSRPQAGMTVIVRDGRVQAIRRGASVPAGAHQIDGSGKFLIPGLWDMHVHFTLASDLAAPLMLATGVTGARDMGGDLTIVDWLRTRIEHDHVTGPRIWRAGPFVDGNKPGTPNRLVVGSAAEARRAVGFLHERGVDFIKVHNGAPPESYFALLAEAKRLGLRVTGHIPLEVDPMQAIDSGHYSIEHIVSLFEGPVAQKTKTGHTQEQAIAEFTDEDARSLARRIVARGGWFDPTLVAYRRRSFQWESSIRNDPRQKYLAASLTGGWKNVKDLPDDPVIRARLASGWKRFVEITRILHQEGVRFLVGTDAGARFVLPGFDVHEELRILVEEVGLPPLQAIQAASRNSAESLGKLRELGTIEVGKIADLVVIDADPLKDIRATSSVVAVIAKGRVHTRSDLDTLLVQIERQAPER